MIRVFVDADPGAQEMNGTASQSVGADGF